MDQSTRAMLSWLIGAALIISSEPQQQQ